MTTIEPPTVPATEAPADVPISTVAPHPDNVRQHLGDLTELVRSIKSHGVLQPLLVLPADNQGVHLVVAGHRRLAAVISSAGVVVLDVDDGVGASAPEPSWTDYL
jgi:ParB/RepB/Spo0J family partition protein